MKKFTLSLLTILVACMTLNAAPMVETRGDTLVVADGGDTVRLVGSQITEKLSAILDDTLVNMNKEVDQAGTDYDPLKQPERDDWRVKMQEVWSSTAETIGLSFIWGMVCLIALIMLFNYLKRRRKYKMVEKAIENNYPLPPYVFDGHAPAQPVWNTPATQQPVQGTPINDGTPAEPTVDDEGTPTPPPFNVQNDPWNGQATQATQQPAMGKPRINWRAFQNCFILVAVGLGLMIMFHETMLVGVFSILVLIGLGKGFIEYQEQRDAINGWRNRQ